MVMFTNTSRVTGLSGIDTEDMILQIMRAESQRLHRLQRRSTLVSWQQEAYRGVSSQISKFQTSFLELSGPNSIRLEGNMKSLAGTSSSKNVGVHTTANAVAGNHTLKVNQLATKDTHTSDTIGAAIKGTDKFDYKDLREGDSFRLALNDGSAKEIKFTKKDIDRINSSDDGNKEFEKVLNEKLEKEFGVSSASGKQRVFANIDGQGRLNIDTIIGDTIKITEGTGKPSTITGNMSADDWAALGGQKKELVIGDKTVTVDFSEFNDPEKPMTQAQAIDAINKALRDEDIRNVTVSANSSGEVTFRATGTNEDIEIGGDLFKAITGDDDGKLTRTNTLGALGGISNNATNTLLDENQKLGDIFGEQHFDENGEMKFTINGKDITLKSDYTVKQMQDAINKSDADVTLNYNSTNQTFTLEADREGASNKIDFGGDDRFTEMLGLSHVKDTGTNALVEFNGVELERDSNNFVIEGIRLELNEADKTETITIEIKNDTERTKDVITNFVNEYNKLIEELNDQRTTGRPRPKGGGYFEPLTDEEKKEMSEEEIKAWEEKAKTGMLHRCDILTDLTSDMRRMLNEPITLDDGTVMKLSDFGITPSPDYKENGKLIIDEEKLAESLETLTEKEITGYFNKLGDNLNKAVTNANNKIKLRAGEEKGLTANNNALTRSIKNYEDRITRMEAQLERREMALFAQFARMESAVMQANSQMDFLLSMMGM